MSTDAPAEPAWMANLRARAKDAAPSSARYKCLSCGDTGWAVVWTPQAMEWIAANKDAIAGGAVAVPLSEPMSQTVAVVCDCRKGDAIHARASGARLLGHRHCVYLQPGETFEAAMMRTLLYLANQARPRDWMTGQPV